MVKRKDDEKEILETQDEQPIQENVVQGLPRTTLEEVLQRDIIKLDLGGGDHSVEGYVNIDIQYYPQVDLMLDISKLSEFFPLNSVDAIMCRDTLQCFTSTKVRGVLRSWYKALKPRSRLVIQCYDVDAVVKAFQANEIDFERFRSLMYGRQKNDFTNFHNCFNEKALVELLTRSGFKVQEVSHPTMRIKIVAMKVK
jgi:predicted SAM-dependent methyltransferase